MIKYAKIINQETGLCEVGTGTNIEFYKSLGMVELDVQKSDVDGNYYLSSKCPMKSDEELAQEEQDRINHLTCTALDLITFIKSLGLTDEQILAYLQANPSAQLQLTLCQNVFCGVVRQLGPLKISDTVTLTDEMVVSFFKKKHNIV